MVCAAAKLRLLCLGVIAVIATVGATAETSHYARISNRELSQRSLQLAKRIKELVYSYNKRNRELLSEYDRKQRRGETGAAATAVRQQWLKSTDALHDSTMKKYKEQYWSDAILLAEEILRRLPREKRRNSILPIYRHPTNVLGVQAVADHLELIAKLLRG